MKMNSCPHKHDLVAYRLDMLSPSERKLIEEHIAICRQCQQALWIESEIDNVLSTPMDPGNIEDIVVGRLRLYGELALHSWWQYPLWVFLNTSAALAAGLGIWIIVSTKFIHITWLTALVTALETSLQTETGMYVMYGCSIAFLLASVFYAFRRSIVKYLVAF